MVYNFRHFRIIHRKYRITLANAAAILFINNNNNNNTSSERAARENSQIHLGQKCQGVVTGCVFPLFPLFIYFLPRDTVRVLYRHSLVCINIIPRRIVDRDRREFNYTIYFPVFHLYIYMYNYDVCRFLFYYTLFFF